MPYPAALLSGWEPAPFTRCPWKCHMQAISWTNIPQIRLQFGCDKGVEEQCIIPSQLGSPRTKTLQNRLRLSSCCRDGSGCARNHLLVQVSLCFPSLRLLVHKHPLLHRSFQRGWWVLGTGAFSKWAATAKALFLIMDHITEQLFAKDKWRYSRGGTQ